MRRRRKPPNICIKPCISITGKSQNANSKNKIENKIENKIKKRPVSNGIWLKEINQIPKRNRALLILFQIGARPPPAKNTNLPTHNFERRNKI